MSIIKIVPRAGTAAQVRAEGARRLNLLQDIYTAEERETWTTQEEEARAWTADNEAETPMLDGILTDGETKAELVASVLAKAAALKALAGLILGAQRALMAMDPIPPDYTDDGWWP